MCKPQTFYLQNQLNMLFFMKIVYRWKLMRKYIRELYLEWI